MLSNLHSFLSPLRASEGVFQSPPLQLSISYYLCYCSAAEICMRLSPLLLATFVMGGGTSLSSPGKSSLYWMLRSWCPYSVLTSLTMASDFVWPDSLHLPNSRVLESSPLFSFATCPKKKCTLLHLTLFCVCACAHVHAPLWACEGQMLMLGVFLNLSPPCVF